MRICTALVPLALLLVAADAKEDAIKKEKAALKGKWQVVTLEDSDGKTPEEETRKMRASITDSVISTKQGKDDSQGEYTIDPTKNPKEIDIKLLDGPEKGKWVKGLYRIDGDTLVICSADPGEDRPKEFKVAKGSNSVLITFKRIKE